MNCPVCDGKTTVIHCRRDHDGVYRRRKCTACEHIFFTSEVEDSADDYYRVSAEYRKERRNHR